MIVILYTTRYREGGPRFAQVAHTLARHLQQRSPAAHVVCKAVESKAEVRAQLRQGPIDALHFVGHSGLYGPMFGTTRWPEQFSPHEWRALDIPFARDAQAFFHACRSARWFAPFFARTFDVTTHGFHWYTAFSTTPDRFRWAPPWHPPHEDLFVAGCPGRKSHGWSASLSKYTGSMALEQPLRFDPHGADASYDAVADDYDAVFDDISVRRDELEWLRAHLPSTPFDVLDLGCGNGALLQKLGSQVRSGTGLDASSRMIELARARNADAPHLHFETVDGPHIPLPDQSLDVAISLLSFRYLDWDPMVAELKRVLRPQGRLLVVDMVERPATLREAPRMLLDKARVRLNERRHHRYRQTRAAMVRTDAWANMLRFNPIRAHHEYAWFLGSRFPQGNLDTLNVGRRAQVIAFDTGPFEHAQIQVMAYP